MIFFELISVALQILLQSLSLLTALNLVHPVLLSLSTKFNKKGGTEILWPVLLNINSISPGPV